LIILLILLMSKNQKKKINAPALDVEADGGLEVGAGD
jgi:hypothetical protein